MGLPTSWAARCSACPRVCAAPASRIVRRDRAWGCRRRGPRGARRARERARRPRRGSHLYCVSAGMPGAGRRKTAHTSRRGVRPTPCAESFVPEEKAARRRYACGKPWRAIARASAACALASGSVYAAPVPARAARAKPGEAVAVRMQGGFSGARRRSTKRAERAARREPTRARAAR
jgi:hypothetical protein